MQNPIFVTLVALLLSACNAPVSANVDEFYAAQVLADEGRLTLVIPVEIEERNGKKSFVRLFEKYGFSGNGPSIEQVVRHNAPGIAGTFGSEGDAFVLKVQSKSDFEIVRNKLRCVEEVKCLATWLTSAKAILLKE